MPNIRRMQMASAGTGGAEVGTLYGWGAGHNVGSANHYPLGDGGSNDWNDVASSPAQVGALNTWVKSGQGGNTSQGGIQSNGTLWMWGDNQYGEVGYGTQKGDGSDHHYDAATPDFSLPVQVGSLTNWYRTGDARDPTFSTRGTIHCVKSDGTLWAWGGGYSGELGNSTSGWPNVNIMSPIQIGSQTYWTQVQIGSNHVMGLDSSGRLYTWGNGWTGRNGHGSTTALSSPVQVGSLTDWRHIGPSWGCSYAVKTDNTLWSWGDGTNGEIGDNSTVSKSSPVQIGTGFSRVWGHRNGGIAIKTDGTLWTWGTNAYGQLGLGDTTHRSVPTQVGSSTDWYMGGTGNNYAMSAMKTDGTIWTSGANFQWVGARAADSTVSTLQVATKTTAAGADSINFDSWRYLATGATHVHAISGTPGEY